LGPECQNTGLFNPPLFYGTGQTQQIVVVDPDTAYSWSIKACRYIFNSQCNDCSSCSNSVEVIPELCGDGQVDPGEECDTGKDNRQCIKDGNLGMCSADCNTCGACGDGIIQIYNTRANQAGEECDLGASNSNTGSCLENCNLATCGDGYIHSGQEECEGPGDPINLGGGLFGTCSANCDVVGSCGDGVVQPWNTAVGPGGEECEAITAETDCVITNGPPCVACQCTGEPIGFTLDASTNEYGGISSTWDEFSGTFENYRYYRDLEDRQCSENAIYKMNADKGLTGGTDALADPLKNYYISIAAINDGSVVGCSPSDIGYREGLNKVSDFTAFGGNEKITLTWSNHLEAEIYEIFRSETTGTIDCYNPSHIIETTWLNTYIDTVALGQTFYYKIRAVATTPNPDHISECSGELQSTEGTNIETSENIIVG
jgi:hypothetical protein